MLFVAFAIIFYRRRKRAQRGTSAVRTAATFVWKRGSDGLKDPLSAKIRHEEKQGRRHGGVDPESPPPARKMPAHAVRGPSSKACRWRLSDSGRESSAKRSSLSGEAARRLSASFNKARARDSNAVPCFSFSPLW